MSREEARALLIKLGIAEPTKENIDDMLNSVGANSKAKDDLVERQKSKIAEIEAELALKAKALEEIDSAKLSDMEKLQKQIDALTKQSELDKQTIKTMNMKNGLAEKGIVGEDADKLIDSLAKGTFDFDTLGKIIADKTTQAVSEKEKELLKGTPNPDGSAGKGNEDSKGDALLKSIGQSLAGSSNSQASSDIVSAYI